jgi:hypothetical protein
MPEHPPPQGGAPPRLPARREDGALFDGSYSKRMARRRCRSARVDRRAAISAERKQPPVAAFRGLDVALRRSGQQFEMLGGYGYVGSKRRSGEGLAIRADPLERSRLRRPS